MIVIDHTDDLSGFAKRLLNLKTWAFSGRPSGLWKALGYQYNTSYQMIILMDDGREYLFCWTHNHAELYSIEPEGKIALFAHKLGLYSYRRAKEWARLYFSTHYQSNFHFVKLYKGMGPTFYITVD